MNIKKVKLIKDEILEVEYTKQEEDGSRTQISETHKTPVHPDLKARLANMRVHLATLTDYVQVNRSKNTEALEPFTVTGFSIGGREDDEGMIVTGYRLTKSGQTVTLNTPFTRFEQPEDGYYHIKLLIEHKDLAIMEVLAYLRGEKVGVLKQTEMFKENKQPAEEVETA